MVHIISSHESYKAEYKYIRDVCQQDRPKGVTLPAAMPRVHTQKMGAGEKLKEKGKELIIGELVRRPGGNYPSN